MNVFSITTARLTIDRLTEHDLDGLHAIMRKPEVMYAWEHGFSPEDTLEWIHRQVRRYEEDGFGYWALRLKGSGELVGQAGLLRSSFGGREVVELAYILDDRHWHEGLAGEACEACIGYAFNELGLDELHCSIRPMNAASMRLSLRLGFEPVGEHVVRYRGKEMPHCILRKEKGAA